MSSQNPSTVDNSVIVDQITKLQAKKIQLETQLSEINNVINNLSKIRGVLTGVDNSTGTPVPTYTAPPDGDMLGSQMNENKRMGIFNAQQQIVKKYIGP